MVRAKFKVQEVRTTQHTTTYSQTEIVLRPEYDEKVCQEDVGFAKATPTGELKMVVDNPKALAELTIGRKFYLDFTPVE